MVCCVVIETQFFVAAAKWNSNSVWSIFEFFHFLRWFFSLDMVECKAWPLHIQWGNKTTIFAMPIDDYNNEKSVFGPTDRPIQKCFHVRSVFMWKERNRFSSFESTRRSQCVSLSSFFFLLQFFLWFLWTLMLMHKKHSSVFCCSVFLFWHSACWPTTTKWTEQVESTNGWHFGSAKGMDSTIPRTSQIDSMKLGIFSFRFWFLYQFASVT